MKRVIIILASAILLVSCTFSYELSPDEVIKVSNTTFEFDKSANSQTLEIESNCSWELKCDASWVTFTITKSGEGKVKNTLSVIENESPIARSAVAEIYNEDYGVSVKINIIQGASAPYIECSKDTISVSYINQTGKIEVESNIPWVASFDDDWIEISPKSGAPGVTTMTINVNNNISVASRSAVIRIVNSEYEIEKEILVVQSESVPELKVNVEKLENISFDGSTEEIEIESNISWEASVNVAWISISPKSGLSGVTTMTINVNKNTSVESRSAVIKIVNSEYDIEQEILVVQSEFVPELKVNREKLENVPVEGSTEEIEIVSNISWEALVDVDWIEISPKSGVSGVTTMTINVNKNTSVESRSSVIRIVNSEYSIEQDILVVQSEFVPELKVNVEKLENISYNGLTEEIKIESNISWKASVNADWINLYPKIGNAGVTLMQIEISENVLEESREAEIILKNEEYSLTAKVKIQQNKLVPYINGYKYVDLGLPSGLKWATCNVGANSPEEYGDYYAWGEIETKSEYTVDNSKTLGKSMSDISGNSTYDVARAKWGGSWRLPTKKELEELESKCTWEWTTQNGKQGYKVTGPNGNSIFLPAAGKRDGSSLYLAGEYGVYWSSTPYESNDDRAYILYFRSSYRNVNSYYRLRGLSVRPVSE